MLSLLLTRVFSPRGLCWAVPCVIAGLVGAGLGFAAVEGSAVSAWDGVWWALTTVTTVGYGDVVPRTHAGRMIGLCVMVVGVGFLFLLAGAVVERFIAVEMRQELEAVEAPEREILRRLDAIDARLCDLDARLPAREPGARKEGASGDRGHSAALLELCLARACRAPGVGPRSLIVGAGAGPGDSGIGVVLGRAFRLRPLTFGRRPSSRGRSGRKPALEESPDTAGQGGREIRPGETRGKVPQKRHRPSDASRPGAAAGKGEKVR